MIQHDVSLKRSDEEEGRCPTRRRLHDEELEVHDMMQKEGALQATDNISAKSVVDGSKPLVKRKLGYTPFIGMSRSSLVEGER